MSLLRIFLFCLAVAMTCHPYQSRRNLNGDPNIYNIHGSLIKLDKLAESIEFIAGIEIIGCTDGADGTGLLTLETKRTEVLHQLIKEAGLMEASEGDE